MYLGWIFSSVDSSLGHLRQAESPLQVCVTPELQDLFCAAVIVFSWCLHDLVDWHHFCRCAQHLIDRTLCAFPFCSMCHLSFWVFLCHVGGDILMQPLCVALKGCVHRLVFNGFYTGRKSGVWTYWDYTAFKANCVCISGEPPSSCQSSRNRPHTWPALRRQITEGRSSPPGSHPGAVLSCRVVVAVR